MGDGAHILVAVSGGADSVALLRALHTLKDRRRWNLTLTVGHVQHHLREDDAEADARFVESLAGGLQLPYRRADLDLSSESGNVEAAARRERYRALTQMAHNCGAQFIATGHHGDDQLETLLMRILRGAGVKGMSCIGWKRNLGTGNRDQGSGKTETDTSASSRSPVPDPRTLTLIRPMLAVSRSDILDYLRSLNQAWREDHTNADLTRWRARLRAEVLPILEDIRPGAGPKATRFTEHMRDVNRVLDDAIDQAYELFEHKEDALSLPRQAGREVRAVVLSGLLRRALIEAGVPGDKMTANQIAALTKAVRDHEGGEREFTFAGNVRVTVTRDQVRIV